MISAKQKIIADHLVSGGIIQQQGLVFYLLDKDGKDVMPIRYVSFKKWHPILTKVGNSYELNTEKIKKLRPANYLRKIYTQKIQQ